MKRILRLGKGYALSKIYLSLLAVATIMCLEARAQPEGEMPSAVSAGVIPDTIIPLQIGDTIPEYLWHLPLQVVNHPEGQKTITLNDYRYARLIILEFWGSMCPPCIEAVDKINLWQNDFGKDFAALPILTRSKNPERTLSLMQKRGWSLPSVVNDTLLDRTAFSRYLPDWGDVWILDGRLLSVPQFGYLTKKTIAAVLNHQHVSFVNKRNVPGINPYQPINESAAGKARVRYENPHSRVIGYLPDQHTAFLTYEQRNDSTFLYMWNWPLDNLLYEAYKPDIHPHLNMEEGVRWEVPERIRERTYWKNDSIYTPDYISRREHWRAGNFYGYQLIYPGLLREIEAKRMMQQDLNAFLANHLNLRAEIRPQASHRYAVLWPLHNTAETKRKLAAKTDTMFADHDENNVRFYGYRLETLIHNINSAVRGNPNLNLTINQVLDSTGIEVGYRSSFSLPRSLRNGNYTLDEIQRLLKSYGLKLSIENRQVPILIVYETDKH